LLTQNVFILFASLIYKFGRNEETAGTNPQLEFIRTCARIYNSRLSFVSLGQNIRFHSKILTTSRLN